MPDPEPLPTPAADRPDGAPLGGPGVGARVWRWTRVVLALGLVVWLVVLAKPGRLWDTLRGAQYLWALAAAPCALFATLLDALRLYLLMRPHGYRGGLWGVVKTNFVVNFTSLFLPGTIGGGAVAWYRLSRPDALRAQTFAALTLNTALKVAVICALGALALAVDPDLGGAYGGVMGILLLGAATPLAGIALMLWTPAPGWVGALYRHVFAGFMPERVTQAVANVVESFERYRDARWSVLAATAVGFVSRLAANVGFLFCLFAVSVPFSYARLLWIMCATEAASMIPLTLSGFGLCQVTYVELMKVFGVTRAKALASHLVGWTSLAPVYAAGALILLFEAARKRHRDREEEEAKPC